ncbi:MAG: hypothetical protein WDM76_06105 [Limisphaerales bacterium]
MHGKVFYDLAAYREEHKRDDVAIIRLEQLYPLHAELLEKILQPYADGTPALWVQEETGQHGCVAFSARKIWQAPFWSAAVCAH